MIALVLSVIFSSIDFGSMVCVSCRRQQRPERHRQQTQKDEAMNVYEGVMTSSPTDAQSGHRRVQSAGTV